MRIDLAASFLTPLLCCLVLMPAQRPASAQQGMTRPAVNPVAQGSGRAAGQGAAQNSGQGSGQGAAVSSGSIGTIDPNTYQLSPQDTIDVTVYKEPTMSASLPIRPDGMISLPLIGDVPAAGMTPMQLGSSVAARLAKFVQEPNVTVTVLSVQPKEIFLLGEVMHVGPVLLLPGMSVLQAISTAGGLTPYANSKHVYVLRTENGKRVKIPFDYKKALKLGDPQGINLLPGDTIVIP